LSFLYLSFIPTLYTQPTACSILFHAPHPSHPSISPTLESPPSANSTQNSAGGGGKTAARQEKIKQKNAKLNEERANRMQREEEAKLEKAGQQDNNTKGKTQQERDEDAIHPSRRARVPYGKR